MIIDGKPLEGKDGAELDLGHIPYHKGNDPCSCGKRGCCECYASGWRLQQIREQYYPDTEIQDMFTLHRDDEPLKEQVCGCLRTCICCDGYHIQTPGIPLWWEAVSWR